jgi:hypothetical protein
VRELACTSEIKRYASSSLSAGRATYTRQVLGKVPKKDNLDFKVGVDHGDNILTL